MRLKARRAPEDGGAEEAPLSERSEFGRRPEEGINAPPAEERRGPMRSIGARQALAVLATFAKTKVARALRVRKLLPVKNDMGEINDSRHP